MKIVFCLSVYKQNGKRIGDIYVSSPDDSFAPQANMTVTVSPDRRADTLVAQRWGPPRKVVIKRSPGAPLGVSIVGGKVHF